MSFEQTERLQKVGECRRCQAVCDKLIEPAACLEIGCRYIYSYQEAINGRTYIGCMYKVFSGEVDLDLLQEAERSGTGFGGLKTRAEPLPHCPFTVEQAFGELGEECDNLAFFDCSNPAPHGYRAFDLREGLSDLSS